MNSVAEIFKRVAAFVGMDPKDVEGVSGHSVRVGATQDLLALNIDLSQKRPRVGLRADLQNSRNPPQGRSARRRAAHLMRISAPPLPSLGRITNLLRRLRRPRVNLNCPGATLVDIAGTDAIRTCRTGVCSHIPMDSS